MTRCGHFEIGVPPLVGAAVRRGLRLAQGPAHGGRGVGEGLVDRGLLRGAGTGLDALETFLPLPRLLGELVEETLAALEDFGDPGPSTFAGEVDPQKNLHV